MARGEHSKTMTLIISFKFDLVYTKIFSRL